MSLISKAAVVLNDILPSLKSMAPWMQDNDVQQVSELLFVENAWTINMSQFFTPWMSTPPCK